MARIVQGLRCMVARVAGPRNIFQHRSMHYGLSTATTGGFTAPSLVKTVQVKPIPKKFLSTWPEISLRDEMNCVVRS